MTNGDNKSVWGDTDQAEAEMVVAVYSIVVDEDRRLNAKKLVQQFYGSLDESKEKLVSRKDDFFTNLVEFISDESNRQHLQDMLSLANKKR